VKSIGAGAVSSNGWGNEDALAIRQHVVSFLKRTAQTLRADHDDIANDVLVEVFRRTRAAIANPKAFAVKVAQNKVADRGAQRRRESPMPRRAEADILDEARTLCQKQFRLLTGRAWDSVREAIGAYAGLPAEDYRTWNRPWNERADIVRDLRRAIDRALEFGSRSADDDPWFRSLVQDYLLPIIRERPAIRARRLQRFVPPAGPLTSEVVQFYGAKRDANDEDLLFRNFGRKGHVRIDGAVVALFRHSGRPSDREMVVVAILLGLGHPPKGGQNAKEYIRAEGKRLARARERFFSRKGLPARPAKQRA